MAHPAGIRAKGLTKTFGERTVFRDVDFDMISGECVVLVGDNGSGKTTFLRCLAGLARPDAGFVRWFGRSPTEASARHLMGMVAHESHLYPYLTLRENLILAGRLYGVTGPARRASQWVEAAGLHKHADRLPREVSHGMRRRTSLARALVHDPPLLLLDEPFSGLDQAARDWLRDLLLTRQKQGRASCLATHDVPASRNLADRVVELRSGRLLESTGTSSDRGTGSSVSVSVPRWTSQEEVRL
jgi:ABC-type multidrug transport system ATPase subunit